MTQLHLPLIRVTLTLVLATAITGCGRQGQAPIDTDAGSLEVRRDDRRARQLEQAVCDAQSDRRNCDASQVLQQRVANPRVGRDRLDRAFQSAASIPPWFFIPPDYGSWFFPPQPSWPHYPVPDEGPIPSSTVLSQEIIRARIDAGETFFVTVTHAMGTVAPGYIYTGSYNAAKEEYTFVGYSSSRRSVRSATYVLKRSRGTHLISLWGGVMAYQNGGVFRHTNPKYQNPHLDIDGAIFFSR